MRGFAHVSRAERCVIRFANRNVPSVTREGLLLLKLYALPSLYRRANLARAALYETDILMLHQGAAVDDEKLLATLHAHVEARDLAAAPHPRRATHAQAQFHLES